MTLSVDWTVKPPNKEKEQKTFYHFGRLYCPALLSSRLTWIDRAYFVVCSVRSHLDRVKRIWYLSPMRAVKVQASLRIRAVSPEPPLLAHTSSESRGTFRQKARSLAPLNGWACAVKICHDGLLEDTNWLDVPHLCIHPVGAVFLDTVTSWASTSVNVF